MIASFKKFLPPISEPRGLGEELKRLPLISIVIPTYNSRRTIMKCLDAILAQNYPNKEIIVVDAFSYNPEEREKCREIIERYGKYLQDGPERSIQRNRGIREAHGEYILVLDQDMYLREDVVWECYEMFQTKKYIALTIPEISIGEGFWTQCVSLERFLSIYLEKGFNECCRFFQKKDAIENNEYDPSIVGAEDSDFHYRMKQRGTIGKIRAHALHDEGRTRFWGRVKKKYYYSAAFRKYLKRYPIIATRQFFPIKIAYFKHPMLLLRHPLLMVGIFLLRGGEVLAGFLGLLLKK